MEREKGEDIAEISKGFIAYQAKGIVDIKVIYCKSSVRSPISMIVKGTIGWIIPYLHDCFLSK